MIWKHIRLAGAIVCMISVFIDNSAVTLFGLLLIATGIVGAINSLEQKIEELQTKDK